MNNTMRIIKNVSIYFNVHMQVSGNEMEIKGICK